MTKLDCRCNFALYHLEGRQEGKKEGRKKKEWGTRCDKNWPWIHRKVDTGDTGWYVAKHGACFSAATIVPWQKSINYWKQMFPQEYLSCLYLKLMWRMINMQVCFIKKKNSLKNNVQYVFRGHIKRWDTAKPHRISHSRMFGELDTCSTKRNRTDQSVY